MQTACKNPLYLVSALEKDISESLSLVHLRALIHIILPVHPSTHSPICPSIHSPFHHPFICLSSIHPSTHSSVCSSIHSSTHLSNHPSIHPFSHVSVHPSIIHLCFIHPPFLLPILHISFIYPSMHSTNMFMMNIVPSPWKL